MREFEMFACIDWSGQAVARPKGLAVAWCETGVAAPALLRPAGGWSREIVLDWLRQHAAAGTDMVIGLDLSPALPFVDAGAYFPGADQQPRDARSLWAMVDRVCADDAHLAASSFPDHPAFSPHFRRQNKGTGASFGKGAGRLRLAELRQRGADVSPSSCFNLVGAAQVGKSSLTGMRVLHRLGGAIPVWPFDPVPEQGPVLVEIYTSIAARAAGVRKGHSKIRDSEGLQSALAALGSKPHRGLVKYDDHSTDAIVTAAWLRNAAHRAELWNPPGLNAVAQTEGWTFGVV